MKVIGQKTENQKEKRFYDYSLLFLTIFLIGFGLVMIYSTSSYNATKYYHDPTFFIRKQVKYAIIGIPLMIFISKIDYRLYIVKLFRSPIRPIHLLYLVCFLLQVAVLIPGIGKETNGSQRWLAIGGIPAFQPSEITKICIILFVAYVVQKAPEKLNSFLGFLGVVIISAPLIGLVVTENFSTALILLAIMVVICFVASKKKLYFLVFGLAFLALGLILIFGVDYRSERIDIWLDIENHPKGYQILQGLYAIASGGLFGTGLGNSMQKLGYIPEAHNDMIFSVICEELGLFGAVAVLLLFILLLWRIFTIAINSVDLFGGLIAVGAMTHIAVQVLINVAVVTNSIPSTGIPLPFISAGGSSLMVLMMEMGIVLSVSNQIRRER